MVGVGRWGKSWWLVVVSRLEECGGAEVCKTVCVARTGWEKWVYYCARRGRGDGESGALTEKLVVDGWWLLVNEREGVPRWGKVCAGKVGAVSGYLCMQHVREVGENRKGWADSKKACATRGGGRGDGEGGGACGKVGG
jgi:hypothetical protein